MTQTSAPRSCAACMRPTVVSIDGSRESSGSAMNAIFMTTPPPARTGARCPLRRAGDRQEGVGFGRASRRGLGPRALLVTGTRQQQIERVVPRPGVVQQRGHGRDRLADAPAWLRVEVAHLEVSAARPHRREQRRQVIRRALGLRDRQPRGAAANAAYAPTGSSRSRCRPSYPVRRRSTFCQIRVRAPGTPAGRPSADPELAKAAASGGPARLATSHCSRPARPGSRSTVTCSEAVRRIIRRPSGPTSSNIACIAR